MMHQDSLEPAAIQMLTLGVGMAGKVCWLLNG